MLRHHLESLEVRTLFAVTLDNGTLRITGTDDAETILVTEDGAGQIIVQVTAQPDAQVNAADVNNIDMDALAGDDTITVDVNRPTTIRAGAGNDTITGSDGGADSVIGQQGADVAQLRRGDDVFVWNPGDGSDRVDGQDGSDTLTFNGSAGDEIFGAAVDPGDPSRVRFTRNLGNIEMDMGTTELFEVNALGGNDTFNGATGLAALIALRFDGGDGNDSMNGTDGADTFAGGAGDDVIDGNAGADTADMGDGNDLFIWDPGDGSDLIEGGDGFDTMRFNGSGGNEIMEAAANGNRLRFTRNLGNIVMDAGALERLDVFALGGTDQVTIGDLRATPTVQAFVDGGEGNDSLVGGPGRETLVGGLGEDTLRGNSSVDSLSGGLADADDDTPDRVLGGNGTDYITFGHADRIDAGDGADELVFLPAGGSDFITVDFRLSNNQPRARFITPDGLRQAIFANGEVIHIDGGSGNDTLAMSPQAAAVWAARFVGGSGNDLLIGGSLSDTLSGDAGADTLIGLEGDDELDAGSGRGQVVVQ
jgi:Ca2+-binding RTX toxin-like protein